jgi:hypothetical protein
MSPIEFPGHEHLAAGKTAEPLAMRPFSGTRHVLPIDMLFSPLDFSGLAEATKFRHGLILMGFERKKSKSN